MPERGSQPPPPCGTTAAHRRHRRYGENPCEPCKEAAREQATARRRKQGVEPHTLAECGTRAAYMRHWRRGEEACDPCRQAMADSHKLRKFWKQLWTEQAGICLLCSRDLPFESRSVHVDHVVPASKGGSDDITNLQAVHSRCNQLKSDRCDRDARVRIAAWLAAGAY